MAEPSSDSVTLHSSWSGITANAFGATLVLAGGIFAVVASGWDVMPIFFLVLGVVFVGVVTLDYPVASTFTADGVVRHMMLRRQRLSWTRIGQLSRTRPGLTSGFRKVAHGGLVAVIGRKRYLLVDHCESADEFRAVEELLDEVGAELLEPVPRPREDVEPTWLYRRSKWAPERQSRR